MRYMKNLIVTHIYDGDTIRVNDLIVRLVGIESFETRRGKKSEKQAKLFNISCDTVRSLGRLQKAETKKILIDKTVDIVFDDVYPTIDRYKRYLGFIRMSPRVYFNTYSIRQGITGANLEWPFANLDYYAKLQQLAKKERKGIWRLLDTTI